MDGNDSRLNQQQLSKPSINEVVAVASVILFLVFSGALTIRCIIRLQNNRILVRTTNHVALALEHTESALKDAETGQRGFLIAGREEYLEPFYAGTKRIDVEVQRLGALIAGDSQQQQHLSQLEVLIAEKLDELQFGIEIRRTDGIDAAQAAVNTDIGKNTMDKIRAVIEDMRVVERSHVATREVTAEESYRTALITTALTTILALGLVSTVLYTILRSRHRAQQNAAVIYASRERLRVTLSSIGDAVITTDEQGVVTSINAVAQSLTQWSGDQSIGVPLSEVFNIVSESTRLPPESPALRAIREGVIVGLANHTVLIGKDGFERSIDDSAAPIRSERGKVVGCVLVFRDVTERRRLERENLERDQQARVLGAIVTSSDDAIISKSLDGIIQSWNAAAERIFGYTEEQAIGNHISMLIPAERLNEEEQIIARLRAGERVEHFETVRLRGDGKDVFVSLTISPIKDASGRVIGASKIARDISEQKQTQDELREHEKRFRTLVEQVEDYAIFMTDAKGRATTWNEGVLRVLGFEESEFIQQDIAPSIFLAEDVEKGVPEAELDEAATKGRASNDRWMKRRDGTLFWATGVTTGLHDTEGKLLGFMKVMRDQTKRKETEDELRKAAAELSDADRRKDEFLATLAHELRNPLAPIRTGLEVMKLLRDDPVQMEQIRSTMERQAQQMVRLIDDLLEMSRITQGKLELRKCHVVLADVIQSAVEAVQPFIDEAGHELSVKLPEQLLLLDADPNRLAQVFSNLLNNSAKYTPDGGRILLSAERQGNDVIVSVKDNGIGIPPDKLDLVFEMFAQIQGPIEKGYTGLGIGLTLVKSLVEMHGGQVKVYSDESSPGSECKVRLPLLVDGPVAKPLDPSSEETNSTIRCRVLVVDDNKAAADMLSLVVKMLGHEVRTAGDGQEGVEMAESFAPDMVLMDIGMPRMDGYEAARYIRKQSWGQRMMLVALTGWGQEDDKRRTLIAGFDHHLVKPAEPTDLRRLLNEIQERTP